MDKFKNKTVLVIPDCHVAPNEDLSRFTNLGNYIASKKPEYIIILGDFISLDSLSFFDAGKATLMDGRAYNNDILAGIEALTLMFQPIKQANLRSKQRKDKQYSPKCIFLEGNHEFRLSRYLDTKPELLGQLDIQKDLKLEEFGFQFVPYKEFYELDDILICHIPFARNCQPISGETALKSISNITAKSVICGHLHRFETVSFNRHGSDDLIQIFSASCFFPEPQHYSKHAPMSEFPCISLLTIWKPGRFDIEQISLERLINEY